MAEHERHPVDLRLVWSITTTPMTWCEAAGYGECFERRELLVQTCLPVIGMSRSVLADVGVNLANVGLGLV